MSLLEDSSFERPRTVRILFYGQSIMGGQWHRLTEAWLRERYPSVDFQIENRALGGFSSILLYRTARFDLHPFQPDLMVFHVYGDHVRYQQLIHEARQRTTAEIVILGDHWSAKSWKDSELVEDHWGRFMNEQLLPAVAEHYGCEFLDVRQLWKKYLEAHDLKPAQLLRDNIHLNDHGCWLMDQICRRAFQHRPELMTESSRHLVKEVMIGKGQDLDFRDGKLEFAFTGNRVDLISDSAGIAALDVLIDGKPPSAHPESYRITRPGGLVPPASWPSLYEITLGDDPVEEDWTLEIIETDETAEEIRFRVSGSITGFDGEGSSREPFVSKSGRVAIDPDSWVVARSVERSKVPVTPGMKIHWQVKSQGVDRFYQPTALGQPSATTLFLGREPREYTLTLTAHGEVSGIRALRIHCPPVREEFTPLGVNPGGQAQENQREISAPTPDTN